MSSVIRDFSQEAVANIRELIKENVDEEKQFFLWDWIDDTFKMDDLNIYDYLDNVSKYQSHMVDKHNINSKKFDTILDRVKNVDVNYANRFNKIYENMILYNKKIVNVANMISPEGITVNSDIYNGVINKFNEIYSDKKIDYLQSDLDDLENEMPVIRDIPWYEKALNGVGGTLVSLARDNIEGIAFIPYGIVDLIFGSNLNYNLSQKLDNAEEYLIKNVVTDKQSYHYGKAVGNAICVAEGIICTIAGTIILVGGVTISAVGFAASATGAGIVVGGVAIAISVPVVAVGTAITAVGGNMLLSSADNFKENISKANKVKEEVDDLKQKEDIKKLDDGIKQAKKDISKIDEGVSKANSKLSGKEVDLKWLNDNYKAVEIKGTVTVNGEVRDISRRVYQTEIDWDYIPKDPLAKGLTNKELALKGRSPYAVDKNGIESKIELHHLTQVEAGSMVEIVATTHDEYTKILHGLVENGGSFRNNSILDKQYSNFLRKYWRWRAKNL